MKSIFDLLPDEKGLHVDQIAKHLVRNLQDQVAGDVMKEITWLVLAHQKPAYLAEIDAEIATLGNAIKQAEKRRKAIDQEAVTAKKERAEAQNELDQLPRKMNREQRTREQELKLQIRQLNAQIDTFGPKAGVQDAAIMSAEGKVRTLARIREHIAAIESPQLNYVNLIRKGE